MCKGILRVPQVGLGLCCWWDAAAEGLDEMCAVGVYPCCVWCWWGKK